MSADRRPYEAPRVAYLATDHRTREQLESWVLARSRALFERFDLMRWLQDAFDREVESPRVKPGLVRYTYPLRYGVRVVAFLPRDLAKRDARRLARWLDALAFEDGEGPRPEDFGIVECQECGCPLADFDVFKNGMCRYCGCASGACFR